MAVHLQATRRVSRQTPCCVTHLGVNNSTCRFAALTRPDASERLRRRDIPPKGNVNFWQLIKRHSA